MRPIRIKVLYLILSFALSTAPAYSETETEHTSSSPRGLAVDLAASVFVPGRLPSHSFGGGSSAYFIVPETRRALSQQGLRISDNLQVGGATTCAFRYPHLLKHLQRVLGTPSSRSRNVFILGPGLYQDPDGHVSSPELHELTSFFETSDRIHVVDILPDIATIAANSRYNGFFKYIARSVIESPLNYVESRFSSVEQVGFRRALETILERIPTNLRDVNTIVQDFADLRLPEGSVDYIFGFHSLLYVTQKREDPVIAEILARYLAALADSGSLYVDSFVGELILRRFNQRNPGGSFTVGSRSYSVRKIRPSSDAHCPGQQGLRTIFRVPNDDRDRFVSTREVYIFSPEIRM